MVKTPSELIEEIRIEWDQMTPEEQVIMWGQECLEEETLDQFYLRMTQLPKGTGLLRLNLLSLEERQIVEEYIDVVGSTDFD